jgi:hypothetical protein
MRNLRLWRIVNLWVEYSYLFSNNWKQIRWYRNQSWTFIEFYKYWETANSEKAKKYVEAITLLVANAVKTTAQTYVNELKKNNSFDIEAQKRALELTKQMVLTQLNDETRKFLEVTYKDLDSYLTCKIESTICELKNNE